MSKKVLIITYYWPPAGGSGVQRWLYFVKYLRLFEIEPIVFTVDKKNYPICDPSLESQVPENIEVIKQKIFEPGQTVSKNNSSGFLSKKPSFFQKFKNYIRANYFIPDAKMFWIRPSTKKIINYLKKNPVDFIISTGPPHSVHLIAKKVKEKTGVKWLADFRDPWTEIDYFHHLPLTKKSLNAHLKLEKEVLENADIVTVVSKTMKSKFDKFNPEVHVISNGYDDVDLSKSVELDKAFTLTHIGMINSDRNPIILWKVLAELIEENEDFEEKIQINLVGNIADEVKNSIRELKLEKFVIYTQYLPSQAIASFQLKSQVLLLLVNNVPSAKNIVTGKIYEYLRAKRPILAIGPTDGDLADIIDETKSGLVIDFNDFHNLKKAIIVYFKHYLNNELKIDSENTEKYHRKQLTEQLSSLINNIKN